MARQAHIQILMLQLKSSNWIITLVNSDGFFSFEFTWKEYELPKQRACCDFKHRVEEALGLRSYIHIPTWNLHNLKHMVLYVCIQFIMFYNVKIPRKCTKYINKKIFFFQLEFLEEGRKLLKSFFETIM